MRYPQIWIEYTDWRNWRPDLWHVWRNGQREATFVNLGPFRIGILWRALVP